MGITDIVPQEYQLISMIVVSFGVAGALSIAQSSALASPASRFKGSLCDSVSAHIRAFFA